MIPEHQIIAMYACVSQTISRYLAICYMKDEYVGVVSLLTSGVGMAKYVVLFEICRSFCRFLVVICRSFLMLRNH